MEKSWKWRNKQINPKAKWSNIEAVRKGQTCRVGPPEKVERHNVVDARWWVVELECAGDWNNMWGTTTTKMRGDRIRGFKWLRGADMSGLQAVVKIFFFLFSFFDFYFVLRLIFVLFLCVLCYDYEWILKDEVVLRRAWRWVEVFMLFM